MTLIYRILAALSRFARNVRQEVARLTPDLLEVGAGLRDLFNNPALDVCTTLTPTAVDNALLAATRGILAQLFPESKTRQGLPDVEAIAAHAKEISRQSRPIQDAVALKVVSGLIRQREPMRTSEADLLAQLAITSTRVGWPRR